MKYLIYLLPLLLLACGPKGDKIDHNPRPSTPEIMVLINYQPLQGSHHPLTYYFTHKNSKIESIYFGGEVINTTSWITFKNSLVGQNLIGALFKNGTIGNEYYIWFKVQLNATLTMEYTLELYKVGPLMEGYEVVKIGDEPRTIIRVSYAPAVNNDNK